MTAVRPIAMRDALLAGIHRTMKDDDRIVFLSGDFGSPVLDRIRADHPDRFFNTGIAEQNLINVGAGLALEGAVVFCYAIAPFLTMRCFEQIRVNLAITAQLRPINVNLIGVGAGYSYVVSGPTHQCYEDIGLMRALPGMRVYSPADHVVAAALVEPCLRLTGPKYLRLDAQVLPVVHSEDRPQPDLAAGFARLRDGADGTLVATGYMVHTALAVAERLAAEGMALGVVDLFNLVDFDRAGLTAALGRGTPVVSLEEAFRGRGGVDAIFFDLFAETGARPYLNLGVSGGYRFELGSRAELHELVGIGVEAVTTSVRRFLADRRSTLTTSVSP